VVEAFRAAEKSGTAAVVLEGRFIDYPVVERSKKMLALAEAIAKKEDEV
jgi:citrate lyase subunit beta/citryl-CoA lyase